MEKDFSGGVFILILYGISVQNDNDLIYYAMLKTYMKKIREAKGMTQGDICRALEVDRAYISNLESGKRNPTLATIKRKVRDRLAS